MIATNGVRLCTVVEGDGPLVVLLHGWPQCWYLWRHQIDPLKQAGYRVAVPDQRGVGGSDCPPGVEDYNILALSADVAGLLDALGDEKAYLVGHDWGCIIAWYVALLYPHRFHGVVGMSVPYTGPKGDQFIDPPGRDEEFWYIRYFQAPGVAEAEFEADIAATVATLYSEPGEGGVTGKRPRDARFFDTSRPIPGKRPEWLTDEDLAYYTEQFQRSGFRGGLNYYRNFGTIATLTPWLREAKIHIPAFFIAGDRDPVLQFFPDFVDAQDPWFDDLREKILIPNAGHWLQQEQPVATTEALLRCLKAV